MIRALPPVPTRDDPTNFALKADAFLAALPGFADDANALEQSLQLVATTGTSVSTLTVGVGSKSLTTQPGKAWATGAWVYVFAAAAVSNYMVGRVTSYDVVTGALVVSVSAIDGSGSHSSWIVGLGTPAADGHLVARDGSRAMTAELLLAGNAANALGAVPKQQAESIADAAADAAAEAALAAARASTANVTAEQNADTFISPDRLKFAKAALKAWVNFDGTGGVGAITPRSAYNVTSVTKNASGDFTVAPSTQADALGALLVSVGSGGTGAFYTINAAAATPTTTSRRFQVGDVSGVPSNPGYIFCALVGA